MATTINASTSAGLVSTADTSGVLQLQAANTTVLNAELGKALALQGATSTTGCGIAFPATQVTSTDANTLDDYEEGTWTPTQGAGLTVSGAFSSAGNYTKIGRQVYVSGSILGATSIATTANSIMVGGLPFTVLSTGSLYYCGSATNSGLSSGITVMAFQASTNMYSAGVISSSGGAIYFSAVYQTT